jgi:hypothetical protein
MHGLSQEGITHIIGNGHARRVVKTDGVEQ